MACERTELLAQGTAPASRWDGPPQEPDSAPQRQAPPWVCRALFAGPAQGPVEAWEAWRTRLPARPRPGCGPLGARVAGRAAQWIPSLGLESRPPSPGAGFSPAPEKPTDTCVSDPPETGNSHGGWGGVAPHTARDTESWTLFSDSDPASPGPSGGDPAGLPECQHPALPLVERRRGGPEQGAGRSELQLARSKRANNYRQNLQKRLQIKAPRPVIWKHLPTSVPAGSFPSASLRFLSFRKNSRPQHSQDSRQGAQVPQQHHENQRPGG